MVSIGRSPAAGTRCSSKHWVRRWPTTSRSWPESPAHSLHQLRSHSPCPCHQLRSRPPHAPSDARAPTPGSTFHLDDSDPAGSFALAALVQGVPSTAHASSATGPREASRTPSVTPEPAVRRCPTRETSRGLAKLLSPTTADRPGGAGPYCARRCRHRGHKSSQWHARGSTSCLPDAPQRGQSARREPGRQDVQTPPLLRAGPLRGNAQGGAQQPDGARRARRWMSRSAGTTPPPKALVRRCNAMEALCRLC
jgi:hypothetical protein